MIRLAENVGFQEGAHGNRKLSSDGQDDAEQFFRGAVPGRLAFSLTIKGLRPTEYVFLVRGVAQQWLGQRRVLSPRGLKERVLRSAFLHVRPVRNNVRNSLATSNFVRKRHTVGSVFGRIKD